MVRTILLFVALGFAGARADGLRYVLIFSRHGVRPPAQTNEAIRKYADQAWPAWSVGPGLLTHHGRALMVQMGRYYRERYGFAASGGMFFASDDMARTSETARALSEGLTGSVQTVKILRAHWSDEGPQTAPAATALEEAALEQALLTRVGGNISSLSQAYRQSLVELNEVLQGPASWMDAPMRIQGAKWTGPLAVGAGMVENLVLEYSEGMPQIGWGRVTRNQLAHLYVLHALHFNLTEGTPAVARHGSGHLAARITASLRQAASGRPVPDAFGNARTRLAVVVGHDGNIISLATLFGLSWTVDGLPLSPSLPGGALVFELWHGNAGDRVHLYYVAQTLDQMRESAVPTLARPPASADLGTRPLEHLTDTPSP
jgi:4-phytase/acid phosphatase